MSLNYVMFEACRIKFYLKTENAARSSFCYIYITFRAVVIYIYTPVNVVYLADLLLLALCQISRLLQELLDALLVLEALGRRGEPGGQGEGGGGGGVGRAPPPVEEQHRPVPPAAAAAAAPHRLAGHWDGGRGAGGRRRHRHRAHRRGRQQAVEARRGAVLLVVGPTRRVRRRPRLGAEWGAVACVPLGQGFRFLKSFYFIIFDVLFYNLDVYPQTVALLLHFHAMFCLFLRSRILRVKSERSPGEGFAIQTDDAAESRVANLMKRF